MPCGSGRPRRVVSEHRVMPIDSVTLSDGRCQGERAQCRRSGRATGSRSITRQTPRFGRSERPQAGGPHRSLAWFLAGAPDLCRRFGPASSAKMNLDSGWCRPLFLLGRGADTVPRGPGAGITRNGTGGVDNPSEHAGTESANVGNRSQRAGLRSCSPWTALASSRDRRISPPAAMRHHQPSGGWLDRR